MSGSIWNPAGASTISQVVTNLTFIGAAARIIGDFSHATVSNRVSFQSATVDGITGLEVIPNGAGAESGVSFHNTSTSDYAATEVKTTATEALVVSEKYGTSAYLPFSIKVNGSNRLTLGLDNTVLAVNSAGLGYGVGSGGSVTQVTSKATGVTINKTSGKIITAGDGLATVTTVSFTVTNSMVGPNDVIILSRRDDAGTDSSYQYWVNKVTTGAFNISIRNLSGGTLSEVLEFNFVVLKGSIA